MNLASRWSEKSHRFLFYFILLEIFFSFGSLVGKNLSQGSELLARQLIRMIIQILRLLMT